MKEKNEIQAAREFLIDEMRFPKEVIENMTDNEIEAVQLVYEDDDEVGEEVLEPKKTKKGKKSKKPKTLKDKVIIYAKKHKAGLVVGSAILTILGYTALRGNKQDLVETEAKEPNYLEVSDY